MIDRAEILAGIKKLPAFSPTVARLAQLMIDQDTEIGEYEAVVQVDVALTANLLRMANSAYFGFARKIGSVREAITLLGPRRLFQLSAMAAVTAVIPATLPGYGIDSSAYWLHSVAVAVLAERISKERKLATPTLTFTAGLLHDIGKLVISNLLAGRAEGLRKSLTEGRSSLLQCERDLLGGDHASIGAELAVAWNLPEEVALVVAHHHEPSAHRDGQGEVIIDLVHAADCLSHTLGFGANVGEQKVQEQRRDIEEKVMTRLGLRPHDLDYAASRALPEIEGMAQFIRRDR